MREANQTSTTTRRRKAKTPPSIEEIAAIEFEAMDASLMKEVKSKAEWLKEAEIVWYNLAVGTAMLTKSPTELIAAFKAIDDGEGTGILGVMEEIETTKDWFYRFHKIMRVIEARMLVAAAKLGAECEA